MCKLQCLTFSQALEDPRTCSPWLVSAVGTQAKTRNTSEMAFRGHSWKCPLMLRRKTKTYLVKSLYLKYLTFGVSKYQSVVTRGDWKARESQAHILNLQKNWVGGGTIQTLSGTLQCVWMEWFLLPCIILKVELRTLLYPLATCPCPNQVQFHSSSAVNYILLEA